MESQTLGGVPVQGGETLTSSAVAILTEIGLIQRSAVSSEVPLPQEVTLRGVPAQEEITTMQPCYLAWRAQRRPT